jgi:hypothetical protein
MVPLLFHPVANMSNLPFACLIPLPEPVCTDASVGRQNEKHNSVALLISFLFADDAMAQPVNARAVPVLAFPRWRGENFSPTYTSIGHS